MPLIYDHSEYFGRNWTFFIFHHLIQPGSPPLQWSGRMKPVSWWGCGSETTRLAFDSTPSGPRESYQYVYPNRICSTSLCLPQEALSPSCLLSLSTRQDIMLSTCEGKKGGRTVGWREKKWGGVACEEKKSMINWRLRMNLCTSESHFI